jgi:hypothetical protein
MIPISVFNPWVMLGAAALLVVTGLFSYNLGSDMKQAEWDKATLAATDSKLDTKGKQDEIQNAPVDVTITARRLRNGSF